MTIDDMIWKLNEFVIKEALLLAHIDFYDKADGGAKIKIDAVAYCHLLIVDKCHHQNDPKAEQYKNWTLGYKPVFKNNTYSHLKHWHPETVKFLKSMEEPEYCEASGAKIG